ncbi:hypothetical protein AcV7_004089 [Taiwanofungus camphoratus]|nr:hypothetical protein AcV7_004089 [Antrodia cinnamomea]
MTLTQPISVRHNSRVISSARRYLSETSSTNHVSENQESDLLRSIRATLQGSRGNADSSIHSIVYAPGEDAVGEEELCWDNYTVIHSSGGIMRKKWSFKEEGQPIQWACIGWFDQPSATTSASSLRPAHYTYDYHDQSTPVVEPSKRPTFGPFTRAQQEQKREPEPGIRIRALFVFLRSIGKVYVMNGTEYTFHLPFIVRKAWPLTPHGVMIQRTLDAAEIEEAKTSNDPPLPTIFTFTSALAEPAAVGLAEKLVGGYHQIPATLKVEDPKKLTNSVPAEEHVVWVSQRGPDLSDDVVVTVNPNERRLSIWRYAFIRPKDVPYPQNHNRPRTMASKRASLSGTPVPRRHPTATMGAADHPPRIIPHPAQIPDLPTLGGLPGMPPSLATTATMANLVGTAPSGPQWPSLGRGRQSSMSRHELSITMDKMVLGAYMNAGSPLDPVDDDKMKPTYWVERLWSEDISQADVAVVRDISTGLFDQRWDGKERRSLIGVCLPATESLLIFRLAMQEDNTMTATLQTRLSAMSVTSIRATRSTVRDLLIVKPTGSLSVLAHGLFELPLQIARAGTDDVIVMDIEGRSSTTQTLSTGTAFNITAVQDAVESSVTVTFSDGASVRTTIDLIPRDMLTGQCLLMLAMTLPAEPYFALHSQFLWKWSLQDLAISDDIEFASFAWALYKVIEIEQQSDSVSQMSVNDPWCTLSCTPSASRSREDSVLKKLKLPPSSVISPGTPKPAGHPHALLVPVLYALHHVAEDLRLTVCRYHALLRLVPVICRIAIVVRPEWADYWKRLCPDAMEEWPSSALAVADHVDDRLPVWPPDMSAILYGRINNPDWNAPWVESYMSALQFKLSASFAYGITEPLVNLRQLTAIYMCLADNKVAESRKRAENALHLLIKTQMRPDAMRYLPVGIAAPIREAARTCQLSPGGDWPTSAYQFIGRNDLAEGLSPTSNLINSHGYRSVKNYILPPVPRKTMHQQINEVCKMIVGEMSPVSGVELDLEDFTQIRFGQDRRLEEVARMLCSSCIPTIKAMERPELSEHDQAKEHQHQVVRLAERTLALPLGRALFTFGSVPTVTREAYAIPKIEFTVRLQPHNVIMAPEAGKIPYECTSWGEFHNGVAAGLRISSQSNAVDSTWIKFNRPSELTPEHAGFLFALGLTGHLREMLTWHTFGYLTPKHDMTSIGVLLGLSAANAGSSNRHVTKLLAVHTPALLPTPNVDLNVPLITQTAGLMGIGLLYMGTKNRRMADVCLNQISRKDLYQPDLSNEYREAYTFAAALACGMVMLGKGSAIPADLAIVSRLRVLVHGEGHAVLNGKHSRPSFDINLTSPAATITLGLMYLRTERQDIADVLTIPDTILALNSIQPSFLLLRTLARALIMWDKITPSKEWLSQQIPRAIALAMGARFQGKLVDDAFELAYYNILAGCCFAVALKYAGTAREEAYLLIIHYYDMFSQLAYTNSPVFDHRIKRAAIRDGLNLISISLNMVMAGTGEINCLRRLRYAYGMYNQPIRYGTHMATHMSLGLLFLGGGRFTLGTSDAAIACMITAFLPRYPHVSSDNKSYLQALRYLWVLAVEPRCLIARDVDTKEVVYLPVKIKVKEGKEVGTTQLISPTLIPDLDKLLSIRVDTPRYWPFYLDVANYPRHKESLLRSQTLFVKRRTAFLSYMEDPKGSRSLFVRSGSSTSDAATLDFPQLTETKVHPASDLHQFISSFSNDVLFLSFADRFCRDDGETPEEKLFHAYCHASLLDAILQDKSQTIQSHITLYRFRTMSPQSRYFNLRSQDLRFATDFYNKIYDRRFSGRSENNPRPSLIRENTLSGAIHALDRKLDDIRSSEVFQKLLACYVRGEVIPAFPIHSPQWKASRDLSWYLQRNSVPVSTLLVVLRKLARQALENCLDVPPPEGTNNALILDQGIKEVLHTTGTQMTTAMGSGWSIRSLDDIIAAWNTP